MRIDVNEPPARESTARRMLQASAVQAYDPAVDIDWDAPLLDGVYFEPPHRCSLYGTALWQRMSEQQRIDLSRHEVASIASVGIWFELILMQMLVRHVYDRDPTTEHVQYALTEIGDECRHSVMFARMIDKLGCPAYGPGRWAHAQGRLFKTISNGPLTFAGALYVEAILDAFQREAMNDESIQPLVRDVSRIHVTEEARHMRYAGDELARQWATLSRAEQAYSRAVLGAVAYEATTRLIHPRVYAAVGLDVDEARQAAADNPDWLETRRWAARKVVAVFDDLDLLRGPGRFYWKRAGVLACSESNAR